MYPYTVAGVSMLCPKVNEIAILESSVLTIS